MCLAVLHQRSYGTPNFSLCQHLGVSIGVSPQHTEYAVVTQACGVFDRSERGKLALTGADAKEFLQGQVSNDVLRWRPVPAATPRS